MSNNLGDAGFQDVSQLLFTHFHSDHFGDFGEMMVNRAIWGAPRSASRGRPSRSQGGHRRNAASV